MMAISIIDDQHVAGLQSASYEIQCIPSAFEDVTIKCSPQRFLSKHPVKDAGQAA